MTIEIIKPARRSEELNLHLGTIVDSLEDELLVIDRKYRVLFANRALLSRLKKKSGEVVGEYCYRISHGLTSPCESSHYDCPVKLVWETGNPASTTHEHSTGAEDKESRRYFSIIASPVKNEQGEVVAVTELERDVTESKKLELETAESYKNLSILCTISSVVSQSLGLDTVLRSALDKVMEIMKIDVGGILLLDEEKQMLCYRAHRGFSSDYVQKVCYFLNEDLDGWVFQTGEPILADNVTNDPRTLHSNLIAAEGLKAFASVPLRAKGKVLGVLNIASRQPHKFSQEDLNLLYSIAPQIAMAVENAKLHQEVQHKDQMRGELLREIYAIQEEERRRISRELHDETSQSLASLAASLEAVLHLLPPHSKQAKTEIKKAQALSLGILGEIHKLIYELRPTLLDDLGLVAATRWLGSNVLGAEGISFDFKTSGRKRRLPSKSEASLFRVIQEAVSNIVKHARAKNAMISMNFRKDAINVHITDDGSGFDVDEVISLNDRPRGLGLLGMRERVEFMGGTIDIKSSPGKGTEIDIQIPLICHIPATSGGNNE